MKKRSLKSLDLWAFHRGGGGFTMAGILLSLTIIGVVAAITLPSLTGNINERTWNTQRKALYARMSQAISLMPALNGYGTLDETTDTATETFVTDGLAKVLKINNICDNTHLEDCGVVTTFTNMAGSQTSMPTTLYELSSLFGSISFAGCSYSTMDTRAAAFETQNGESIVVFYNQSCTSKYHNQIKTTPAGHVYGFPQANMCVNFIYDLNRNKGPNTVGKDIGIMSVFNNTDSSVVAPIPSSAYNAGNANWYNAAKLCTNTNPETRIPNINELSAMLINKDIVNLTSTIWSSSVYSSTSAWNVTTDDGYEGIDRKVNAHAVRCVLR